MQSANYVPVPKPDSIRRQLVKQLENTVSGSLSNGQLFSVVFDVQALLESLPLASGEFSVLSNRLRNARRYLQSDERGAATYELRLLMGDLREARTRRSPYAPKVF